MKGPQTRHHLVPKSRGGSNEAHNILIVTGNRHEAFHTLVGNATPSEALILLARDWNLLPREVLEPLAASLGVAYVLRSRRSRL